MEKNRKKKESGFTLVTHLQPVRSGGVGMASAAGLSKLI